MTPAPVAVERNTKSAMENKDVVDELESSAPAPAYVESSAVFEKLRRYGDDLLSDKVSLDKSIKKPLITTTDHIFGFAIERYYLPISVCVKPDLNSQDPILPGLEALQSRAEELGATGILSVRWALSPTPTWLIVSGTPVRINPIASRP